MEPKFNYFVFLFDSLNKSADPAGSFRTLEEAKAFAYKHRDQGAKVVHLKPTIVYSIYEPIK